MKNKETLEEFVHFNDKWCNEMKKHSKCVLIDLLKHSYKKNIKMSERMYSEEEVELIANEMVNWAIDNIGNPNPQSGKKFDEVLNKFKNK